MIKEVKIVKEVKRSDGLWRFACGDVSSIDSDSLIPGGYHEQKYGVCVNSVIEGKIGNTEAILTGRGDLRLCQLWQPLHSQQSPPGESIPKLEQST